MKKQSIIYELNFIQLILKLYNLIYKIGWEKLNIKPR